MNTFKVFLITLIAIAGIAYAADKTFRIDKIIENTDATGVDVDGINIKDTTVKANTGDLTLDSTNQIIISKEVVFQAGTQGIDGLGDIKQSILTEAQFQARHGTDWVAMKGQVLGSEGSSGYKICDELSLCTLPDARNRFLRNSDAADTNLGCLTTGLSGCNDTTAVNGLSNVASTSVTVAGTNQPSSSVSVDGTLDSATVSGTVGGTDGTHTHAGVTQFYSGGDATPLPAGNDYEFGAVARNNGSGHVFTQNSGHGHSKNLTVTRNWTQSGSGSAAAQIWTQSGTGSAAAQAISGDVETAPDHIIVNTFVKVN